MTYSFSIRSATHLDGVKKDLRDVAYKAIKLSKVDFGILDGARTHQEHQHNLLTGASKTKHSKHLDDPRTPILDGSAIDVGAYVNGKLTWKDIYYYQIAEAFREASLQLKVPIRYGGSWHILNSEQTVMQQVEHYVSRKRAAGQKPFLDIGHFELA